MDGGRQVRWLLVSVLLLAALVASLVGVSLYYAAGGHAWLYGWWPWAPFGWFFLVPLFFVAFFALRLAWWGPWAVRAWYQEPDPAMRVLRERFARGEISREQFDQLRTYLSEGGGGAS